MRDTKFRNNRRVGFTLVESMISVLLILIVVGGIFRQMQRAQAGYRVEGNKLDMTQQQRDLIDLFTRDLHQVGYPAPFSSGLGNVVPLDDTRVSAGITSISTTSLTMEGDLDNTGVVQVVTYSLNKPGGACPCSITRTVGSKDGATIPVSTYTPVQNLIDPGAQGIFTAYAANGGGVGLPQVLPGGATSGDLSYATMKTIRSVRITFTVQSRLSRELNGKTPIQVTMTGMARIPND